MTDVRVLCVDPDETARTGTMEGLREGATDLDVETVGAGTLADAETLLAERAPVDCLVTEYDLPDGTGLELVDRVRSRAPDVTCILYSASGHGRFDTGAHRTAVAEYVDKGAAGSIGRLARLVRVAVSERAQTSYPIPQNESERLAALSSYDLDAAGLEESLSRVTDLAATHFGLPTASINVIGEHAQEFLACHGAAESWAPTPREDSICTFALLDDEPVMTVEDVADDPRFETNGTLADLGIRAYMGADVRPGDRATIGTLCVYDDEPNAFSAADRRYLRTLAEIAADLIEAYARPDAPGSGDGGRGGADERTDGSETR